MLCYISLYTYVILTEFDQEVLTHFEWKFTKFFFLMWYTYDMHFVDYMYLYVNLFYQFYMQLNMTRPLVAKHVQNIQW